MAEQRPNQTPECVCPPNTVQLVQISRGLYAPSMSNFSLKLETYLRMAKISYVNDFCGKFSPKGKTPFMVYNGEVVSDSQFCIEYLNKKLNVDLNKGLKVEERAVAKAIQVMTDEHLYWAMIYFRWVYDEDMKIINLALPELKFLKDKVIECLHGQGLGRHQPDEVKHIMLADFQALTDFLGKKPYIMGQTPTETDCSVFGLLSQFVWHMLDDVCEHLIQEKFPTLYNYCIRMKEQFWPDWDDCITHGRTKIATK